MVELKSKPEVPAVAETPICRVCGGVVEMKYDSICKVCNRPVHVPWNDTPEQTECAILVAVQACCGVSVVCKPCATEARLL